MCANICEFFSFILIVFGVGLITLSDPCDPNNWWARQRERIYKRAPWEWLRKCLQRRYILTQFVLSVGGALGITSMILSW